MKIFSFIFSFCILFLIVEPVLNDIDIISSQKTESCCGSSCEPMAKNEGKEQSNGGQDNNNKTCNPFQSCKCCIGTSPDFVFLTFTPIQLLSESQTASNEKIPLQIALDFWKPPKVAKGQTGNG